MTIRFLLCTVLLLAGAAPLRAAKAAKAAKAAEKIQTSGGRSLPSVALQPLIDSTMTRISTLEVPPKKVNDRLTLMTAKANYVTKQQTASPGDQPMYQAAIATISILIAAVDEHDKAVANFRYSQSVRGVQDTKDQQISNTHTRVGSGITANANARKEAQANAESEQEAKKKGAFLSHGANTAWKKRLGEYQTAVERSYTTALLAEKKAGEAESAAQSAAVAAVKPPPPATPAPAPAQKKKGKQMEPKPAAPYSLLGTWSFGKASWVFNADGSFKAVNHGGQWKWTDESKGELELKWDHGRTTTGAFTPDGKTLNVGGPAGKRTDALTR